MPQACTICVHPDRDAIESAIIAGTSLRAIARQFGVSKDAVARHRKDDIAESVKQSQEAIEEARSLDVVRQLKDINDISRDILKEARKSKEPDLALKAIDRIAKQLELQAKLLGDIGGTQVNVYLSPEWRDIRKTLLAALSPYHDARLAVASALAGLEDAHARLN